MYLFSGWNHLKEIPIAIEECKRTTVEQQTREDIPMARFPLNPPFDLNEFVRRLIAETFFYDDDAGIIGSLSLIDEMTGRECFIASFMPEEGSFIIEECTEWEEEEGKRG